MPNVSDVYIPQDLDYPGHRVEHRPREGQPDRALREGRGGQRDHRDDLRWHGRAELLDRSQERQQLHGDGAVREPVDQQHVDGGLSEHSVCAAFAQPATAPLQEAHGADDLPSDDWRGDHTAGYTPLGSVADIQQINTPTEVDHYQIRRVIDIYVATKTKRCRGSEPTSTSCWRTPRPTSNTVLMCAARW